MSNRNAFAPTQQAMDNLLEENIHKNKITITGNTIIDALFMMKDKIENDKILKL